MKVYLSNLTSQFWIERKNHFHLIFLTMFAFYKKCNQFSIFNRKKNVYEKINMLIEWIDKLFCLKYKFWECHVVKEQKLTFLKKHELVEGNIYHLWSQNAATHNILTFCQLSYNVYNKCLLYFDITIVFSFPARFLVWSTQWCGCSQKSLKILNSFSSFLCACLSLSMIWKIWW